jgi:hypothetical protein
MAHALANDPSLPDCLAAAFARVRWQVVTVLSDGRESIINCVSQSAIDSAMARNADIAAHHAANGTTFRDGTTILETFVREI